MEESSVWLDGLENCKVNDSVGCYVDVKNNTVTDCGTGCPKLDFNGVNYTYKTDGTDGNSIFTRTVRIDDTVGVSGDEAKVSVSVKWTGKYGGKTVNLQDNIFNWR